jgi:IS30 family transposase
MQIKEDLKMKTWKHINLEQRKVISSGIAHNDKLVEISERLSLDPRSISKEVKRNRIPVGYSQDVIPKCPNLNRRPLVCTKCKLRYSSNCTHIKFKYDAQTAQKKADANLINSRKGIDTDSEELKKLDSIIKRGTDEKKSIYQIKIENNDVIDKSITTLYRYINNGYLTTKRMDLPYAVKYKKRKHNKKYDYSNNKIDRTGHTYLDYLSYIHKNPRVNVWQLDFLGAIKTDSKNILSFILPEVHFTILEIISNPNSNKVVKFFDDLENKIGTNNFIELIPVILTDRDPCFADIEGICFSKITGEERCKLFFCDPYVSNQKPHVENINKQIRKFFPKGKSVDNLSKKDILKKNITLLDTPIKSLDGNTPREAFNVVYGEDLFYKIFDVVNDERK